MKDRNGYSLVRRSNQFRSYFLLSREAKETERRKKQTIEQLTVRIGGVGKYAARLTSDLGALPDREWTYSEKQQLRRQLGLTHLEFAAATRSTGFRGFTRQYKKKRLGTEGQRLEFLRHWLGEVKKRRWYRWEPITYRI